MDIQQRAFVTIVILIGVLAFTWLYFFTFLVSKADNKAARKQPEKKWVDKLEASTPSMRRSS